MQPNGYEQPNYSPQPTVDPYAFLNETKKPNRIPNPLSGGSFKAKLVFGLVALFLVIVLIAVIKSVFSGNNQINTVSLYSVMSEQQELINLATIGSSNSSNPVNQDLAATVIGVVNTDQNNLIKLLDYNNLKINTALFVLQPSVDGRLNQVQQSSNFDPLFTSTMQQQFGYYKNDLLSAYKLNVNPIVRKYLNAEYKNLSLLMQIITNNYS